MTSNKRNVFVTYGRDVLLKTIQNKLEVDYNIKSYIENCCINGYFGYCLYVEKSDYEKAIIYGSKIIIEYELYQVHYNKNELDYVKTLKKQL